MMSLFNNILLTLIEMSKNTYHGSRANYKLFVSLIRFVVECTLQFKSVARFFPDHSIPLTVALSLFRARPAFFFSKVITPKCVPPWERCVVSIQWFDADWLQAGCRTPTADSETRLVLTRLHRIGGMLCIIATVH